MNSKKTCHGCYKLIKQIERHMINVQESNNYRRMHGIPLRRKIH